MGDLITWLRDQIDEDERVARESMGSYWYMDGHSGEAQAFIARFDEDRELAEVDAKRRILDLARDYSPELGHGDNGEWALGEVLRMLALPYADQPGYREEWRP